MKRIVISLCLFAIGLQMGISKVGAVSEEDFQSLKRKVYELEKYTFPPEKAEEIKKVTEYVCSNGHIYSSPTDTMICPEDGLKLKEQPAFVKVKLDRREAVGDKISAALEEEFKKRVHVALSGTGIVQHLTDSLEQNVKKETFTQGSIDIYFISRPMKNTIFFIDAEAQGGATVDSTLANNSVMNNDATSLPSIGQPDQIRLREAWIQRTAYRDQLQFIIGKIDITNYFDRNRVANDETSQFLTGTLVNLPLIGNPSNGPGATLFFDSRKGIATGVGIQSSDASGKNVSEEPFFMGEVDFRFRILAGQLGNYRFWISRNGRTTGQFRDNYSIGMSADQEIGSMLTLFGRVGRAVRKEEMRDPHAWSTGFMLRHFIPQRKRDQFGVGYSHYLTVMDSGVSGETENAGEVYYSIFLSDHLSISPIGQYMFHSAGTASGSPQSNVFILGLRTQIYF